MRFTVVCSRAADGELAALWLAGVDRGAVTDAALTIESLLETMPLECGESRDGNTRILFVQPLGVRYAVFLEDRRVDIVQFWSF